MGSSHATETNVRLRWGGDGGDGHGDDGDGSSGGVAVIMMAVI